MKFLVYSHLCGLAVLSTTIASAAPLTLHPKTSPLPTERQGPFIHLSDSRFMTAEGVSMATSADGGKTWKEKAIIAPGVSFNISRERTLLKTKEGTILLACMNLKERVWNWNSKINEAGPGTRLPTYLLRGPDEGARWEEPKLMHEEWTGAVRDMIQMKNGRIVFVSQYLAPNPSRHVTVTYSSDDDGRTWKRSNVIDLGGHGHHDGAIEGTLEQLKDGRVRMLLRTTYGAFWDAISEDGIYWTTIRKSNIPAATAPAILQRVGSGRLVLVWNRPYPEGKTEYKLQGGKGAWAERPASNHRGELSIAFSEDDGKGWSKPVVIARQPGASLAYPYVFESEPGNLWITTMQGGIRLQLKEADFVLR